MFENFSEMMLELFVSSLWETIIMVGVSGLVGGLIGIPLGVFLRLTDHGGVLQNGPANKIVGWIVNALRSTPFIILLVAIIPLTRLITGSSIGTAATMSRLSMGEMRKAGYPDSLAGAAVAVAGTLGALTADRDTTPVLWWDQFIGQSQEHGRRAACMIII